MHKRCKCRLQIVICLVFFWVVSLADCFPFCHLFATKEAEVEEVTMELQKQLGLVRRKETKQRIAAALARRGVEARRWDVGSRGWDGGAGEVRYRCCDARKANQKMRMTFSDQAKGNGDFHQVELFDL